MPLFLLTFCSHATAWRVKDRQADNFSIQTCSLTTTEAITRYIDASRSPSLEPVVVPTIVIAVVRVGDIWFHRVKTSFPGRIAIHPVHHCLLPEPARCKRHPSGTVIIQGSKLVALVEDRTLERLHEAVSNTLLVRGSRLPIGLVPYRTIEAMKSRLGTSG